MSLKCCYKRENWS